MARLSWDRTSAYTPLRRRFLGRFDKPKWGNIDWDFFQACQNRCLSDPYKTPGECLEDCLDMSLREPVFVDE